MPKIIPKWNFKRVRPHLGAVEGYVPLVFASWYSLPNNLERELCEYLPDGMECQGWSWHEYTAILCLGLCKADRSVWIAKPAYHHLRHFVEVVEAGAEQLRVYEEMTGRSIPVGIKQAFLFALALHDYGHGGCTFRSMAPDRTKLVRPDLGVDVSAEYISIVEADKLAKEVGFNPPLRLFIAYVIASTTTGGNTEEGRRIGIAHIEPNDLFGCMARLADVYPKAALAGAILDDCAVTLGEVPATPQPGTLEEMLQGRVGFLNHLQSCLDKVDEQAGFPLTEHLGRSENLRQRLARYNDSLSRMSGPVETMEEAVWTAIYQAVYSSYRG